MSNQVTVEVDDREQLGKGPVGRLRRSGMMPAVVYGGGRDPQAVVLDPRPIESILDSPAGFNTLIQLNLAGRDLKRMVMLRDVQRHPVNDRLLHADFVRVELDQPVTVTVPVHTVGEAEGVRVEGGSVQHISREILVRVLPTAIPDSLEVEITALKVGQTAYASDVELSEGVELVSAPTDPLLTIAGKVVEEVAVEEGVEAAEGEAPAEGEQEAESGGEE